MEPLRITPENQGVERKKNQNIQVFVRVRPMNGQETAKNAPSIIDTPGSREVVVRQGVSKTFTFDRVFGARSKQVDVYKAVVAPLLSEVLLGYNCTVFAYGQTGTGKTFTMEGERSKKDGNCVENDPQAGILPRALSQLFDEVRMLNHEFSVRVSFLELYNEELFDLLAPIEESKTKTLRLYEDTNRKGSVIISGLEEVIVNNKQEVYNVLDRGSQQRKTAATLMNAHSSRSHTIFTITVHLKESTLEGEDLLKIGKLHLVDLAGSENIGKSGAQDKRAREAGSINQSLLTLGRVISALVERAPHVPYRESKLTRLLQDSLGGKTKTSIIATVGPAQCNVEETLSTLDYAHRAKNIMNKPEVNQKLTKKEALNIYTDEIERLRRDLNAARDKNGIYMDAHNHAHIMTQIQAQHAELNEKSNKIKEQEDYIMERENLIEEMKAREQELLDDLAMKECLIAGVKNDLHKTKLQLMVATKDGDELKYLVKYHKDKGAIMNEEAQDLLNTASDTLKTVDQLNSRLERKQGIEERNWSNSQRFRGDFRRGMDDLIQVVDQLREGHTLSVTKIRDSYDIRGDSRNVWLDNYVTLLNQNIVALETTTKKSQNRLTSLMDSLSNLAENATTSMREDAEKCQQSLGLSTQKVLEGISALKTELAIINEENTVLGKDITAKFNELRSSVKSHFVENTTVFNEVMKSLKLIKDKYSECIEESVASFSTYKNNQAANNKNNDVRFEELLKKMEAMQSEMNSLHHGVQSLRADTRSQLETAESTFSAVISSTQKATGNMEPAIEEVIQKIYHTSDKQNVMDAKLSTYENEVVKNHMKKLNDINTRMTSVETKTVGDVETAINESVADQRNSVNKIHNDVLIRTQEFMSTCTEFSNNTSTELQAQSDQVASTETACVTSVQELFKQESDHSSEIVDTINEQCDIVTNGTTKVNSMLQQAAGNVDEFWEQTYLYDTPNGGSPMRRRYDLPSKLTLPSPHSRIMSRYRAVNREVEHAIKSCSGSESPGVLDRSWSENYFNNMPVPDFKEEIPRSETIEEENEENSANTENECPEPVLEPESSDSDGVFQTPIPPKIEEHADDFKTPRNKTVSSVISAQLANTSSVSKAKNNKKKGVLKAPNKSSL